MPITLYSLAGSPYCWRVVLALELKELSYRLRPMSYDAGDFKDPALAALNPRRRVPVLVDDDFVLYESAAIVEYLEDTHPNGPRLFAAEPRQRALQRRLVREADQYLGEPLEQLVQAVLFTPAERRERERISSPCVCLREELVRWEALAQGPFLAGSLSAADFTLYPMLALLWRMAERHPGYLPHDLVGPTLGAWMDRMRALPLVERTWPAHWRA